MYRLRAASHALPQPARHIHPSALLQLRVQPALQQLRCQRHIPRGNGKLLMSLLRQASQASHILPAVPQIPPAPLRFWHRSRCRSRAARLPTCGCIALGPRRRDQPQSARRHTDALPLRRSPSPRGHADDSEGLALPVRLARRRGFGGRRPIDSRLSSGRAGIPAPSSGRRTSRSRQRRRQGRHPDVPA